MEISICHVMMATPEASCYTAGRCWGVLTHPSLLPPSPPPSFSVEPIDNCLQLSLLLFPFVRRECIIRGYNNQCACLRMFVCVCVCVCVWGAAAVQVRLKGLLDDRGRFQPGILCLHPAPATLCAGRGAAPPHTHTHPPQLCFKGEAGS